MNGNRQISKCSTLEKYGDYDHRKAVWYNYNITGDSKMWKNEYYMIIMTFPFNHFFM